MGQHSGFQLAGVISTVFVFVVGCGDDYRPPPAALESCRAGWQPLTAPRLPFLPPHNLAISGGELVYDAVRAEGGDPYAEDIEAQPIDGGPARVIADATASDLWVEGGEVLYATGGVLSRVPVTGGTPTAILGEQPPPPISPADLVGHFLTPDAFYWWASAWTHQTLVWSQPRDGATPPRLLAALNDIFVPEPAPAIGTQALVVSVVDGRPVAMSLADATLTTLASPGPICGADARGVYGSNIVAEASDLHFRRYEMHFAPADGGPARPFWPSLPPWVEPRMLWADGDRGWLVAATERFDDGRDDLAIYFVDQQGVGRRAACDAGASLVVAPPAFTSDAAYLVVAEVPDSEHGTWRIIKVPRS